MTKSVLDLYLWFFFSLWLIVDSFTGLALNLGFSVPLSQVFKLLVLLLLIIKVSRFKRYLLFLFFILTYLLILLIHHGIRSANFILTISHLTKLLSTIYLYFYFVYTIKLYQNGILLNIKKVFIIGFLVISVNLTMGLFDIGFHTYVNEGIGYKGFFYAGNELGGVIACIIPFVLYVTYWNYSTKAYCILSIFILTLALILSTKSVLLICFLSVFVIPWLYGTKKIRTKLLFILLTVGLPLLIFMIVKMITNENDLMIKYSYAYQNKGLMGLILSDRDLFWKEKSVLFESQDFYTRFFGLGENITVEMDLFDVLLNYGYFGCIATIGIYSYLFIVAFKYKRYNSYNKLVVYQDFLLLLMSLVAGHILFSSMAGIYIALINSLIFIRKNIKQCVIELKKY